MPATETIDFEREFADVVRELRALPAAAPTGVRERVRALGEPAARRSLPPLPWRRSLLVLAPVCALGLVVAAVVHGVLNSGPSKQNFSARGVAGGAQSGEAQRKAPALHFGAVTTTQDFGLTLAPSTGTDQ